MTEPLDEDLLLISRIKGLRSKNVHAQAQTSKMHAILADLHDRQQRENQRRLESRRRTVKVVEKVLRSPKMVFAVWRTFIEQRKRHQHQEELVRLHNLQECRSSRFLMFSSWRSVMFQDKLTLLRHELDQVSAHASTMHQANQVRLSAMRLQLLKERRSHRLADTRAALAGLQVLGANLAFGLAPCATTSELTALCFCAWHLRTAMSGQNPWTKHSGLELRVRPAGDRNGAKALRLSCRIVRQIALRYLSAWKSVPLERAKSHRLQSVQVGFRPREGLKVSRMKKETDAPEILQRWHRLQVCHAWRCASVVTACERRVKQEAKAAASECALLQQQVEHWRFRCKETCDVATLAVVNPAHVFLAWRFISHRHRRRSQREQQLCHALTQKVLTAWRLFLEQHRRSIDSAARVKTLTRCLQKETNTLLRLIFFGLQMHAQVRRAEREGFFGQSDQEHPSAQIIEPGSSSIARVSQVQTVNLQARFKAYHDTEKPLPSNVNEQSNQIAGGNLELSLLLRSFCALRMAAFCRCDSEASQRSLEMVAMVNSSQGRPGVLQRSSSAPSLALPGIEECNGHSLQAMSISRSGEACEANHSVPVLQAMPAASTAPTAAGPTPGDKAKYLAITNSAGPLPPVGSPRRPWAKAHLDANQPVASPETVDSPVSAGWTSSVSFLGEPSGAQGSSYLAFSPPAFWSELDLPCSARIVENAENVENVRRSPSEQPRNMGSPTNGPECIPLVHA